MRPTTLKRAHSASRALGVLCFTTTLAVLPSKAQSDDPEGAATATAARVADVTQIGRAHV